MAMAAFDLDAYILSHIQNGYEWHLPFLPSIHLPPFLSLHGLMLLMCAALLIFVFVVLYKKDAHVPKGLTNSLELIVLFIRDHIVVANLGREDGRKITPFFCTLFFFILGLNLLGIIPVFSTATSNVNVTGSLAVITLGFMTVGAILKNGPVGFIKALCPPGVPWPMLLILFPLEFISLFIRAFALMIRLFANMLAGHIVLFTVLGLVVISGVFASAVLAVPVAVCLNVFEVGVAFLQAYIFTLFSAIFIGLMYHPQH